MHDEKNTTWKVKHQIEMLIVMQFRDVCMSLMHVPWTHYVFALKFIKYR